MNPETHVLDVLLVSDASTKYLKPLSDEILAAGFPVATRQTTPGELTRFLVICKGCAHPRLDDQVLLLKTLLERYMGRLELDRARFPAELRRDGDTPLVARIEVPLRALSLGTLRPYGEGCPEAHDVVIRTDDPEGAGMKLLQRRLTDLGFTEQSVLTMAFSKPIFRIVWGALDRYPALRDRLRGCVAGVMRDAAVVKGFRLRAPASRRKDVTDVIVDFPIKDTTRTGAKDTTGSSSRTSPAPTSRHNFKVKLFSRRSLVELRPLIEELNRTFTTCEITRDGARHEEEQTVMVRYGGADDHALGQLDQILKRHLGGIECVPTKVWDSSDRDIYVSIPEAQDKAISDTALHLQDYLAISAPRVATLRRPFVERDGGRVRIGEVTLPIRQDRSALVPPAERFRNFALDRLTAEVVAFVARSVAGNEHCLLEGPTATTKSSGIAFVAHLIGAPLMAPVVSTQDPGDLVSRFAPDTDRNAGSGFRVIDGVVTRAAREGAFLALEEINLAPPPVVERLNSLVEQPPYLILTETTNELVEPHPDFRLFATRNSASYQGREAMSPAALSRWVAYLQTPSPGEEEYHQFLRFMVFGEQPTLTIDGVSYAGTRQQAPHPALAEIDGIASFLERLARLHSGIERAATSPEATVRLGGDRREPYVFSRRTLIGVLGFLEAALRVRVGFRRAWQLALARYFLARVAPTDRQLIVTLAEGIGIGPREGG